MLYWVSGCITSSMRLYYEHEQDGEGRRIGARAVTIPAGFARFPADIFNAPSAWCRHSYKRIVRDATLPRGGHFAAWEVPELFAEEVRPCFLKKTKT